MSSSGGGGGGNPRFSLFLRAIGIKPGFRRTGPSSLINIAVVSFIGVVSGRYIFQEPLEEYWREERRKQLEASSSSSSSTGASAAPSDDGQSK